MSTAGNAQRSQRSFLSAVRRWLHEPLVHFLLLGAALFGGYSYFEPRLGGPEVSKQIDLTPDELLQLALVFQSQWRRLPTQAEFGQLVENKVQEEVLYREAVAMGLDKDDTIVKRRMAQKMQFLAEDVAAAYEPTRAELDSWYAKNADKFALPGRINFRHLYFSPDRRGAHARDAAEKALAKLADQPITRISPHPCVIRSCCRTITAIVRRNNSPRSSARTSHRQSSAQSRVPGRGRSNPVSVGTLYSSIRLSPGARQPSQRSSPT